MSCKKSIIDVLAAILVIVGAINWGLVGLFKINLVTLVFGTMPMVVTVVYALVGLAGFYAIYMWMKCCKKS